MTVLYTAQWVLPVATSPIQDGAVAVAEGRIVAVGSEAEVRARLARLGALETVALGRAALCPGFVNVHSHLELTALRGRLEDLSFFDWIRTLTRLRGEQMAAADLEVSAQWGVVEAARAGITTLADTETSGAGFRALCQGGLRGIAYQEVFGPDPMQAKKSHRPQAAAGSPAPGGNRPGAARHLSPRRLFRVVPAVPARHRIRRTAGASGGDSLCRIPGRG